MARSPQRKPSPQATGEPASAGPRRGVPAVSRLQRTVGNRAVAALLQRQKDPGLYEVAKTANLRDENTHEVLTQLPQGSEARVRDKGLRQSKFKAGLIANEHSWSAVGRQTGWIEDSKLKPPPTIRDGRLHLDDRTQMRLERVTLGDVGFVRVVGTDVLIYDRRVTDPGVLIQVRSCLTRTVPVYRGIAVWHSRYADAVAGRIVPMGQGPPNFVTKDSKWVPFSDGLGEATVAAKASHGESNPGMRGGLDEMQNFDRANPDQEIGRIVEVQVGHGTGIGVCFFNVGEVQIRGPAPCRTHSIFRVRDLPAQQPASVAAKEEMKE